MKKIVVGAAIFSAAVFQAQLVTLSKAVKKSENLDKFLYKVDPAKQAAEYLGEVEVEGYSPNDPEIFTAVYKKAKTIRANAFSFKPTEAIEGSAPFDAAHYRLNLYYSTAFPKEDNIAYLFNTAEKPVRVKVDGKKMTIQPRSYIKKVITYGGVNTISAGTLLGSVINLSASEGQPVQYFQVMAVNVQADASGSGGLNLKSGDIIGLEKSYANFLSIIYKEQKYK